MNRNSKRKLALSAIAFLALVGLALFNFLPTHTGTDLTQRSAAPNLGATAYESPWSAQISRDVRPLLAVLEGLKDIQATAEKLRGKLGKGDKIYNQEEDDLIRSQLLAYLNYRTALFRLLYRYRDYESIPDENLRTEAFLMAYASGLALFEKGLVFVESFKNDDRAKKKLNEGDSTWNVPSSIYNTVRANLSNENNYKMLQQARAVYETSIAKVDLSRSRNQAQLEELKERIDRLHKSPVWEQYSPWDYRFRELLSKVESGAAKPAYKVQSLIATILGDTKLPARPGGQKSLISLEQVQELKEKLKPGDIILERRNWYLSNAFLPGFWPHAALYVGTAEDLEGRGLKDDEFVGPKLARFKETAHDGHEHRVIEALSEGVVFSSLEEATLADYIAVLRPKLAEKQINEGISKAFSHYGKPYDFEFDFFSTDKIVCTELVYRSYDGRIRFGLIDVLGRRTLPAIEIVTKFAKEHQSPEAELEFVLFLDGDEDNGNANYSTLEEFINSVDRSAFTWLN